MSEKNINQEFRLKKIDEMRNYLIEEVNQNKLMNKKHKNVCRVLNYIDHLLIKISTITGWVSISTFSSLVGIPIEITSPALGLKTCAITAEIKRYKSQYFMLLSCHVSVSEWIYTSEFPEYQETPCLFTK